MTTKLKIPGIGEVETPNSALIFAILGAVLVALPFIFQPPGAPPLQPMKVTGTVKRLGHESANIAVGIIPGSYLVSTDSNGRYAITVPKGEWSYTALAYYTDNENRQIAKCIGITDFNNNEAKFNIEFE